jgi:hypothetical protein
MYSPERMSWTIKSDDAKNIGKTLGSEKDDSGQGAVMRGADGHGDEQAMQQYLKNQERKPGEYQKIHEGKWLEMFPCQNKT